MSSGRAHKVHSVREEREGRARMGTGWERQAGMGMDGVKEGKREGSVKGGGGMGKEEEWGMRMDWNG